MSLFGRQLHKPRLSNFHFLKFQLISSDLRDTLNSALYWSKIPFKSKERDLFTINLLHCEVETFQTFLTVKFILDVLQSVSSK